MGSAVLGLIAALVVGGILAVITRCIIDWGNAEPTRKDTHTICVICNNKAGSGLKTFPVFDNKPVCFPCQCRTGHFQRFNDNEANERWRKFTELREVCRASKRNWWEHSYMREWMKLLPTPEPETAEANADRKLRETLESAMQSVFDSWALVNPLRLKVWRELNNIPEPEATPSTEERLAAEIADLKSALKNARADVIREKAQHEETAQELTKIKEASDYLGGRNAYGEYTRVVNERDAATQYVKRVEEELFRAKRDYQHLEENTYRLINATNGLLKDKGYNR